MSPIYKGNAFKQFLIDRYAMGFEPVAICQEFEAQMGIPISEAEVESILKGCSNEIQAREDELIAELKSQNVVGALLSIKAELAEVASLARADKDYKTFAQLANSSMKSLEVLIGMTEKFRQHENTKKLVAVQNNYYAIEVLVKDGLIEVKDERKLKSILGVVEDAPADR
jgi:hypothetical protein